MENGAIPVCFARVTSWLQPPFPCPFWIQRVYLGDSTTYNIVICYTWRRMRYDRETVMHPTSPLATFERRSTAYVVAAPGEISGFGESTFRTRCDSTNNWPSAKYRLSTRAKCHPLGEVARGERAPSRRRISLVIFATPRSDSGHVAMDM